MSLSTEVKQYRDRTKFFAKQSAELRNTVVQEYQIGLKKFDNEADLRASLMQRFELTERKLNHILDNQNRYLNAKEQAFTSGLVMNHYVNLINVANQALQGLDEYVEHIEQEMADGKEFIEVEQYAGAKGTGVKALTPREALRSVLREKVDIVRESFEPLKALAPKIIQVQGDGLRFDTMEELEEQERIEVERLKINKGEKNEEN